MYSFDNSSAADIAIRFALISRAWRKTLDSAFTQLGLTDATWAPLLHLAYGDGISQKELAQRVGVEPCTLVRVMDILEERGLVERRADQSDRRSKRVFMSTDGRTALARLNDAKAVIDQQILADFDRAELNALGKLFHKIEARLLTVNQQDEDSAA